MGPLAGGAVAALVYKLALARHWELRRAQHRAFPQYELAGVRANELSGPNTPPPPPTIAAGTYPEASHL